MSEPQDTQDVSRNPPSESLEDLNRNAPEDNSGESWTPDAELAVRGQKLSPFKARVAMVRGCGKCRENVEPSWKGGKWVCRYCHYRFRRPPTFVDYIRCVNCGSPEKPAGSKTCRQCAYIRKPERRSGAAINRYEPSPEATA